jgi:hypothetical protein
LLAQQIEEPADRSRHASSYLYTPLISQDDFVRQAVAQQLDSLFLHYPALVRSHIARYPKQAATPENTVCASDRASVERVLAYVAALHDADGQRTDDAALDVIAALLERAEAAERQATTWEGEARRAQQKAQAATARAEAAERRATTWENKAQRVQQRIQVVEEEAARVARRVSLQQHALAKEACEYYDPSGICRVCEQPVPTAPSRRRDGLRVCEKATCRQEAFRRDNAAKQRQFRARRREQRGQAARMA